MKPCHENNGAAIYVGRAATLHNPLFYRFHHSVEYLNKNVSIGQLLKHIPNSIVVCAGSRPKRQTKTYNKEVCQVS